MPPPSHVIAHLSDTHVIAGGDLLGGHVDTVSALRATLATIGATRQRIDAVVVSGDLVDRGDPASYELFGSLVQPACAELGAELVVTGGNHDDRGALGRALFGEQTGDDEPSDRVHDIRGLRIITMDSARPGSHAGGFSDDQYHRLATELATPPEHGTILVMHHPPIPYRSPVMQLLDFQDPHRLAQHLEGTDVRAILCGHLHVTTSATLGSVPVHVAGGASYVDDVANDPLTLHAVDACQSWNLLEVHAGTIVSTVVPARPQKGWPAVSGEVIAYLDTLSLPDRRRVFAAKQPKQAKQPNQPPPPE